MKKRRLQDLSIIFSVKIDSQDRLENLRRNLDYYAAFFSDYELILIEQDEVSRLDEDLILREGVRYYFIPSQDVHYKTRNLNFATHLSTRPFVMMCDVDVILPPDSLREALHRLKNGVSFLSPHNGVMVELKKGFLEQHTDILSIVKNLDFFPKDYDRHLGNFQFDTMVPLYGSSYYDSTGGCILYNKNDFVLIGGWNTNIVSYGYEDMEFVYRLKKLGYTLEMMERCNIYHFEHIRKSDSMYNNYCRSNEAEWNLVNSMVTEELRQYAMNGFRRVAFAPESELHIINTTQRYSMEVSTIHKIDLNGLSIILPVHMTDLSDISYLNTFILYLELYFHNYEIILVESEFRNCKYLLVRKNVKYVWMGTESFDESQSIAKGIANSNAAIVAIWDYLTLIEPNKFYNAVKLVQENKEQVRLPDENWYLHDVNKTKSGAGVTIIDKDNAYRLVLQRNLMKN